jgi:hypothetical protein
LVFAQDESEALDVARSIVLNKLVDESPNSSAPYDSAVDFTGCGGGKRRKDEIAFAKYQEQNGKQGSLEYVINRFGDIPAVLQVSTKRFPCDDTRGMDQVNNAMDHTLNRLKDYINYIRKEVTENKDEELLSYGFKGSYFRNLCRFVAEEDMEAFLYDFRGRPIHEPAYLRGILNDTDKNHDDTESQEFLKMISQKLWVVPFDVHLK